MAQAQKFHAELGTTQCEYSTGWFTKFKHHHSLQIMKISGEKVITDVDNVEVFVDKLPDLIAQENNFESYLI